MFELKWKMVDDFLRQVDEFDRQMYVINFKEIIEAIKRKIHNRCMHATIIGKKNTKRKELMEK